jgi:hypothetical protein
MKFSTVKLVKEINFDWPNLIFTQGFNFRVGKKPGKFEKTHGNGKNWFLPGKMGKTGKIAFFKIHV